MQQQPFLRLSRIMTIHASLIGSLLAVLIAACNSGCGGAAPITVTISPPATQMVDQGDSVGFTAAVANDSSNKGVSWSATCCCSGSPCGTFSPATTASGALTTYTAPSFNVTVTIKATSVQDISKSATVSVTVPPPPTVTTSSLPDGMVGVAFNATLQASGGIPPYTWTLASGSTLPAGLTLSSSGAISGTPSASGGPSLTFQVADSGKPPLSNSTLLRLTVASGPLSVSTTSLPDATIDTAYRQPLQASGGLPPYTWTITSGSVPWATVNPSGNVSGIPAAAGTANFTVQVMDAEVQPMTSTQSLFLTAAPGTSPNVSELNGHYAFLFNGFDDASGSQVAIVGSFTADGAGKITNGVEDLNGPSSPALNVSFTGTYNIGTNHQGGLTINTANGAKTYDFILSSISSGVAHKARLIEFDDTTGTGGQRGSGIMRLQDTTAFALASITGPYAFGFVGQDPSGKRNVIVGSFTSDGAGKISSGEADQSIAGTSTNPSLTGLYTAPSSTNGRGTITLAPSGASAIDLSAYVVSANELLGISTDAFSSAGVLSGTILLQTSSSFSNSSLNAPAVYYETGTGNNSPATQSSLEIALFSPDGSGNLTVNYDGQNGSGTASNSFTGTYSVASNGRVNIPNYYGNSNSPLRVLYLVDLNKGFFLDTGGDVGFGFLEPQSAAPSGGFTNASLTGTFAVNTTAPTAAPNPNASGLGTLDGTSAFTETVDFSATSGVDVGGIITGTYSIMMNGRGTVTNLFTTAMITPWPVIILIAAAALLLAYAKLQVHARRPVLRRAFAAMGLAFVIAGSARTAFIRRPPPPPRLVFYMISPAKFVLIDQNVKDANPVVTIFEQ